MLGRIRAEEAIVALQVLREAARRDLSLNHCLDAARFTNANINRPKFEFEKLSRAHEGAKAGEEGEGIRYGGGRGEGLHLSGCFD